MTCHVRTVTMAPLGELMMEKRWLAVMGRKVVEPSRFWAKGAMEEPGVPEAMARKRRWAGVWMAGTAKTKWRDVPSMDAWRVAFWEQGMATGMGFGVVE